MSDETDPLKAETEAWFGDLRDRICAEFEALEDALAESERPAGRFERTPRVGVECRLVLGTGRDDHG